VGEGVLDVVIFRDDGSVREVVSMGDGASGSNFYYRLAEPAYHTVVLRSDLVVFHETTNGPFRREETETAPWAPPEGNAEQARQYLADLDRQLDQLKERDAAA
jgi:cupin fold WbuC family metalloprotein